MDVCGVGRGGVGGREECGLTRKGHKETFSGDGNVVYLGSGLSCIDDMF